jgi:hypothetical protein
MRYRSTSVPHVAENSWIHGLSWRDDGIGDAIAAANSESEKQNPKIPSEVIACSQNVFELGRSFQ